ncbi:MAG TPA: prepilin-type N-terminal cleavage/methylation domain-containing protein [Dehalococcoidales bacterium]|nr:prepilin-type N-terminal cleavage/methylation domain-containing protein [Dehalococcoidales bacterium]
MIFHKEQRGFMLVELLVALAITGLIAGGITTAISQVFIFNMRSSAHMTAIKQVESVVHWISRDAQMAKTITADPGDTGFPLSLTWTDYGEGGAPQTVIYTIDSAGLWRDFNGQTMRVAQYIDPATNCQLSPNKFTFAVTATVGIKSETRVCEVMPRPN